MTMTLQKPETAAEEKFFRVGNFALYSHRNCEQARAHFGLSNREVELLMFVAGGFTKNEIATRMGITTATADTFRRRAYSKLGVNSGTAAVTILAAFLAGTRVEEREFGEAA